MRYRYQFLLALYKKRKCHPDNKIWIYQHKQILQGKPYEKIYLYQRTSQKLDSVSFLIRNKENSYEFDILQFEQLKRQYMPYLKGCILELPEELAQAEYTLQLTRYVLDGQVYDYVEDTIDITLEEKQTNEALSSCLQMNDITIYPLLTESYYICACGHLNRLNEECENCHRAFADLTRILETGSSALCKEGFLKRHLTIEAYQKCGSNPTAYLAYLQNTAAGLPISIEEKDIQTLVEAEKKSNRNTILSISILSILLSLLIILTIFVLPQATSKTPAIDDLYTSDYNDFDTPDYDDFDDNSNTYRYTICEGSSESYPMNIILEGYGNRIDYLTIEVIMTNEDLDVDLITLDETEIELFKMGILSEFGLTGNEAGIETDVYVYDNLLYCDIIIDSDDISDETLSLLGLSMLRYYTYDLAVMELQSQDGMYCY